MLKYLSYSKDYLFPDLREKLPPLKEGGLQQLVEEAERQGRISAFIHVNHSEAQGALFVRSGLSTTVIVSRMLTRGSFSPPQIAMDPSKLSDKPVSYSSLSSTLLALTKQGYAFGHIVKGEGMWGAIEVCSREPVAQGDYLSIIGYVTKSQSTQFPHIKYPFLFTSLKSSN